MPILSTDILWKYSIKSATAGNQLAQSTPANATTGSLGKFVSTTQWTGGGLNDLFDDISGDDNFNSVVDYRCVFVHNNHSTNSLLSPVIWYDRIGIPPGGANIAIAWDSTAQSALASGSPQALFITDDVDSGNALSGLTFSASATSKATGVPLGTDLVNGNVKAVWIKRSAIAGAAVNGDGFTVHIEGDTLA